MSRTVTVYSTAGDSRGQNVASAATTWGALQGDLTSAQIAWQGMKAIEGVSKHTFDSPDATLPEGDFRLFLMPIRTKSGGAQDDAYSPPAENESLVEEETIPDNLFGKAAQATEAALSANEQWLEDFDKLRIILAVQDLSQLAWRMKEENEDPVTAEMKDIAKGIKDVSL